MTELLIPIGPLYNEDGTVNIENTMRTHRFVQYADWKRWKASQDPEFPKDKLPKEEFYTKEFLDIMANDKDGILEKLPYIDESGAEEKGIPEQSRKTIGYLKSYLSKTGLSLDEARRIRATMRKYLKGCPMADPFGYMKGEFRTLRPQEQAEDISLFGPEYLTPQKASEKCIKPLEPMYSNQRFNFDAFMREHRYVLHSKRVAYARKKEGQEDTSAVHYSKNFLIIVLADKFDVHKTLGLDRKQSDILKNMSGILKQEKATTTELARIEQTIDWILENHQGSKSVPGEFAEDRRTDEEKTMDLFLKENYRRPADRPFSRELLRGVTEQAFLDRLAVPYTSQELDKDTGELQTKEHPPVPASDIAAIAAMRGKTDSMDTQQLLGASKKVGFILYKCAFAKERLATKDKRQRREVSPQSKPRMIYSELRLECGELYADRNPSRGKYRGKLGTRFSDSLLLTITDESVMKTIGIPEGKDLVSGEGENAFLSDSFEMKVPIKDKYGIDYRSVYAARIAASVDSEERRRQIAVMPVSEAWKTPEAKASVESENNNAPALRRALVELKYKNNPELAELLMNTGDARIIFGKSGKMDKTTVLLRSSIAKGKGIDIPDTAWFRDWRQKILEHKDDLQTWWKNLSEGDKDSFNICLDVFVTGKFREYKAKHPQEFPQVAPPMRRNG